MHFLVDECCDDLLVRYLRENGHNVLAVKEMLIGADDAKVMEFALREERILLTEDKDFGQLVFAYGQNTLGVIFLRYPASDRHKIANILVDFVNHNSDKLLNSFVTIQTDKIRINKLL